MKTGTVVIVGRANVGKSSLFNKILKRKAAVVSDREGITRDLHFQQVEWEGATFQLVDTGGYIAEIQNTLERMVVQKIHTAIKEANVAIFMVDGRTGITDADIALSRIVQRVGIPVICVANKMESKAYRDETPIFWKLGLGEPLAISALRGLGLKELMGKVIRHLPDVAQITGAQTTFRLAILGRPNSGKSSFVNSLTGQDTMLVSREAGTTRDSIDTLLTYGKWNIVLTDTAGLRKKSRVKDEVEYYCNLRSVEAIRRSDVCLLLLDIDRGIESQDLKILSLIEEAGKGCVVGLNKWDLLEVSEKTFDSLCRRIEGKVPETVWLPKIALSGLTGKRIAKVMDNIVRVYQNMHRILGREAVIDFFQQAVSRYPHPYSSKGIVKMKRCCQVTVNPPGIAIEVERPQNVFPNYIKYLKRFAHEYFELDGVPIKIFFRRNLKLRTDLDMAEYLEKCEKSPTYFPKHQADN